VRMSLLVLLCCCAAVLRRRLLGTMERLCSKVSHGAQ
jgi:hypothetical protein